jgi:hypothetical protein
MNKAAIMERCIRRMREEYAADPTLANHTHLDALTLNIERASPEHAPGALRSRHGNAVVAGLRRRPRLRRGSPHEGLGTRRVKSRPRNSSGSREWSGRNVPSFLARRGSGTLFCHRDVECEDLSPNARD